MIPWLFNTPQKVIDIPLGYLGTYRLVFHPFNPATLFFGDQDTVLDPSALILSFGIAIGILPIIVVVVIDPILNTRHTLRDLLNVYYGEYVNTHHTRAYYMHISYASDLTMFHIICLSH